MGYNLYFSEAMGIFNAVIYLEIIGFANGFFHWMNEHLLSCPFKSLTGVDCPGCGIQRSLVALFQGNLSTSLKLYPATIPMMVLVSFVVIHLKFDFKNGAYFIKMLYIGITLIVVFNYVYKIFTNQLI